MSISRPPSPLLPAPGEAVLACDIGSSGTSVAWIDHLGDLQGLAEIPAARAADERVDVAITGLRRARDDAEAAGATPVAIGVGAPGMVMNGVITSDVEPTSAWPGTDIGAALTGAFDLPHTVLSRVHAHGLGEAFHGNGQGTDSMLLVVVGQQIDGAFVTNGRLLVGAHGVGGHIGHVAVSEAAGILCRCGKTGHLEGLASESGILRAYRRHGVEVASTWEVFARARDGERLASDVIADCAFATGRAIGDLINVLGPGLVAVAGEISEKGSRWWVPLHRGVRATVLDAALPTPVVPAHRQSDGPLRGAATAALQARA